MADVEAREVARRALADTIRLWMPRAEVERVADAVADAVVAAVEPGIRANERDRLAVPGDDRP